MITQIKANDKWIDTIKDEANAKDISIDSMLILDAIEKIDQRRSISKQERTED